MPVAHDRARVAGVRSAVLVTLVAAGVAACVSAGGAPEPKAPGRVPVSAGSVADGPRGAGEQGRPRPAGKGGMSPSPVVSGGKPSAGAPASVSASPGAHGKTADRALPPPADGPTVPQPTAQASPTAEPPASPSPSPDPTTEATTDPPTQPPSSPDPTGSPAG